MQRPIARAVTGRILRHPIAASATAVRKTQNHQCDVFLNHRGVDTKKTIAGLLYHHLRGLGLRPFLDSKSMRPGDRLFDNIDPAIDNCKVGVAVFSRRYCDSYFCLHELALMMEKNKRVVPIFCDVKPSELRVEDYGVSKLTPSELLRFRRALEEAKLTVGLSFDSLKGDWSDFLADATNIITDRLIEVKESNN